MTHWWEIATDNQADEPVQPRGVAYYRHSAQDRQENSIPIQMDQVRQWAKKHGIEIIKEFSDAGKSGLNAEDRPAFTEMMEEWVKQRDDFEYVLCLDVSRWGRFQDIDNSALLSAECKSTARRSSIRPSACPRRTTRFTRSTSSSSGSVPLSTAKNSVTRYGEAV